MAQFDVYHNPNPDTRKRFPYLLDVQDDMLEVLATRVVVPLMPLTVSSKPMDRLNPVLDIEGRQFAASVPELAGVPKSMLGTPVANVATARDAIIAALDFLFTGI
ncbi:MAG: CcdB family protein [Mariprofundaceae bacterium]|nr:CcdB family protein [Mariprofundaceae bacterium]